MRYKNQKTLLQLIDAAFSVANRNSRLTISIMFNIELKFAADTLLKWFNIKLKSKNVVIDPKMKINNEIQNQIHWEKDKCCICNFPLQINRKGLEYQGSHMPYVDFLIPKENKFLRSIYSKEKFL